MAKRIDFSSENPFLKDYYSGPPINPISPNAIIPVQMNAFETYSHKKKGLTTKLGYFYEVLTSHMYGGKMKRRQNPFEKENTSENGHSIEPDVTSDKYFRESKGVNRRESLKLTDSQMAKYAYLNFNSADKKIKFEVYRHSVDNLFANFHNQSTSKLIKSLAENTIYSLSLPFSIMFDIYSKQNGVNSRYEGDKYSTLTRFLPKGIDKLLLHPEETLEGIGIDPLRYRIIKGVSPKELTVNGTKFSPFPVLTIEDLDLDYNRRMIEERVQEFIDLPEDFVINYGQLTKDISYLRKHWQRIKHKIKDTDLQILLYDEKELKKQLIEAKLNPEYEEAPY